MIPDCSRCGHAARYHGRALPVCDVRGCRCTSYATVRDPGYPHDYGQYCECLTCGPADEDDEETIADAEAHREDWQDYLEFQRTSH